jgi:hypothetical protein
LNPQGAASGERDAKDVSVRIGLVMAAPLIPGMTPPFNPGHFETTAGSTFKCFDTIPAGECLSRSDKENFSNRDVWRCPVLWSEF